MERFKLHNLMVYIQLHHSKNLTKVENIYTQISWGSMPPEPSSQLFLCNYFTIVYISYTSIPFDVAPL